MTLPDAIHIQILKYLEPFGVGTMTSINPVLSLRYPSRAEMDNAAIQRNAQAIKAVILDMAKPDSSIIRATDAWRRLGDGAAGHVNWLDDTDVEACILTAGLAELSELRKSQSDNELKSSVIATNTAMTVNADNQTLILDRQTKIFRWTMIFAGVAALFTIITFVRDDSKARLQLQLEQSGKEKQSLQMQLQRQVKLVLPAKAASGSLSK